MEQNAIASFFERAGLHAALLDESRSGLLQDLYARVETLSTSLPGRPHDQPTPRPAPGASSRKVLGRQMYLRISAELQPTCGRAGSRARLSGLLHVVHRPIDACSISTRPRARGENLSDPGAVGSHARGQEATADCPSAEREGTRLLASGRICQ